MWLEMSNIQILKTNMVCAFHRFNFLSNILSKGQSITYLSGLLLDIFDFLHFFTIHSLILGEFKDKRIGAHTFFDGYF